MTITRIDPGKRLSDAVRHNNTLYLAGQVAKTPTAGIEQQTREVLEQIDAALKKGGSDKSKLLSAQIFLASMADFAEMNKVWDSWIDTANLPARATTEARLADPNLRVEIMVIAACD
jgi:enamine deaminase RidA (YjgF/YER057c/UK114 family)